jgi:membrane-associated protein
VHETWEFLKELTDPNSIIEYGGLALLLVVVFAETGLLIGFFLPGDSLIFISGIICSTKPELLNVNLFLLITSLTAAAVLGNVAGYWFGRKAGPPLFKRDDSILFKKRYLETTHDFYARHGGKALVLGRFLPIIRTFAPILAGVIKIDFKLFMLYNITGAIGWIASLSVCGYYLGRFEWVRNNIAYIVIFLIVITIIPVINTYRNERKRGE